MYRLNVFEKPNSICSNWQVTFDTMFAIFLYSFCVKVSAPELYHYDC